MCLCNCGEVPSFLVVFDDSRDVQGCNHCIKRVRANEEGVCPRCQSPYDVKDIVYKKNQEVIGCGECTLTVDPIYRPTVWDRWNDEEYF